MANPSAVGEGSGGWCKPECKPDATLKENGDRKQLKLVKAPNTRTHRQQAEDQLVKELAARDYSQDKAAEEPSLQSWLTVGHVLRGFLRHSQQEHAKETADWHGYLLEPFLTTWGRLRVCLNRIRNALELLLDDLRIPRGTISARKRVRLTLHRRIELLEAKKPNLKDICGRMMAVKHLGNAGSHSGEAVERKDVFDGFDILERVLHDMYSTHEGELAKMVSQINKRKGPRKAKG